MALPYDLTIQINEAHVAALKTCDLLKDTIDIIDDITTTLEDGKGYVRGAKDTMLQHTATGVIPMRTVGEITREGVVVPVSIQRHMIRIANQYNVMRARVIGAIDTENKNDMHQRLALGLQVAQEIEGIWTVIMNDMEHLQAPNQLMGGRLRKRKLLRKRKTLRKQTLRKQTLRGKTHRGKTHRGKTHRRK